MEASSPGVLVTGATGAAGSGVLGAFLDHGWRVAATHRGEPPTEPAGVTWLPADLTDPASTRGAVDRAVAALAGLDALVCLAGGFGQTAIDELTWDDVARQLDLNLRTTVEAVTAARSALEARGGAIVTVGSQTAQRPGAKSGPNAAAKAAVVAWSASLAKALAPRGVRVNCVLPGTIDTPENRAAMPNAKHDTWVTPRQLGELMVWLASPASAPMTGAALPIG